MTPEQYETLLATHKGMVESAVACVKAAYEDAALIADAIDGMHEQSDYAAGMDHASEKIANAIRAREKQVFEGVEI